MEPHAVPRQITTFEFKLIGFVTLKQFIYLIVFTGVGVLLYLGFPIPLLNILFSACAVGAGAAFAFLPINDRPLDVWVTNFFNRLMQPSQYYYHKKNQPPAFLTGVYMHNPALVANHIDAQQKLNKYIQTKNDLKEKEKTVPFASIVKPLAPQEQTPPPVVQVVQEKPISPSPQPTQTPAVVQPQPMHTSNAPVIRHAFLTGQIKSNHNLSLSNILVYVKNQSGQPVRILKSNNSGNFATFHALPTGDYLFEPKDPSGKYFFDTMKIQVNDQTHETPIIINSKELL